MQYKLVCSDIDGTLLNNDRVLSKRTIDAIKSIGHNFPIILVSSRMPKAMRHLQKDLEIMKNPLIAYNGGLIIDYENGKERILFSEEISLDVTALILQFVEKSNIHISLYHNDDWLVPAMDYWAEREQNNTKVTPEVANLKEVHQSWMKDQKGPHKIMCMGEKGEIQLMYNYLQMHHAETIHVYRSKDTYIEIASKTISKLTALTYLLEHKYTHLKLSEVVAFGDNFNDEEMIAGVGMGVAVANAKDIVKAAANKITLGNKEDGVAIALEEIFAEFI
jgi:Cof subfamily protein (haloacid dehalogenase superfamily)